jgi:hypothetical protein
MVVLDVIALLLQIFSEVYVSHVAGWSTAGTRDTMGRVQ